MSLQVYVRLSTSNHPPLEVEMNVPAQMIGPLADAHRRTVALDVMASRRSRRRPTTRARAGGWRSLIGRPTRHQPARRPTVGPTPALH
jgi:hypothetical protein